MLHQCPPPRQSDALGEIFRRQMTSRMCLKGLEGTSFYSDRACSVNGGIGKRQTAEERRVEVVPVSSRLTTIIIRCLEHRSDVEVLSQKEKLTPIFQYACLRVHRLPRIATGRIDGGPGRFSRK